MQLVQLKKLSLRQWIGDIQRSKCHTNCAPLNYFVISKVFRWGLSIVLSFGYFYRHGISYHRPKENNRLQEFRVQSLWLHLTTDQVLMRCHRRFPEYSISLDDNWLRPGQQSRKLILLYSNNFFLLAFNQHSCDRQQNALTRQSTTVFEQFN